MIKDLIEKARKEKDRRREQLVVHREKLSQSIQELKMIDDILSKHEGYQSIGHMLSIETLFPSLTKENFNKDDYLKEYDEYTRIFSHIKGTVKERTDEAARIIKEYINENQQ